MWLYGSLLLALLALLCPSPARAGWADDWRKMKQITPKGYVCYRASGPVVIDGKLDDDAWQNAPWTDDFQDIEGSIKPKPRFRTRARMLWDDRYLYIGAVLEEPHVWGTLTEHDAVIFNDNDFEIFIDPNGDTHEYYEIEINALNTEWDLFLARPYKDGGPPVNGWEIPGLKTAVHVDGTLNNPSDTDRGWSVEFALPWKALLECAGRPGLPADSEQWRIDFSRVEWAHEVVGGQYRRVPGKREDNWIWSPPGVIDMHRPEKWGYLQFSTAAPGTAAYRPDPAGPSRDLLFEIYYHQRDYREKNGRWAKTLKELGLPGLGKGVTARPIRLETTTSAFEATAVLKSPDDKTQTWHIRQDSKVWQE
ncbi:MAG: carbohydrate-binding family 9-like protein [Armatimonadetes bacterium]|nr:carbohydrate-binding family 9-like protein [Armatimonadota bacterium]